MYEERREKLHVCSVGEETLYITYLINGISDSLQHRRMIVPQRHRRDLHVNIQQRVPVDVHYIIAGGFLIVYEELHGGGLLRITDKNIYNPLS